MLEGFMEIFLHSPNINIIHASLSMSLLTLLQKWRESEAQNVHMYGAVQKILLVKFPWCSIVVILNPAMYDVCVFKPTLLLVMQCLLIIIFSMIFFSVVLQYSEPPVSPSVWQSLYFIEHCFGIYLFILLDIPVCSINMYFYKLYANNEKYGDITKHQKEIYYPVPAPSTTHVFSHF